MQRVKLYVLIALVGLGALTSPTIAHGTVSQADLDCSDFASEQAAQEVYLKDTTDPYNLDVDGDGQACEGAGTLPSPAQGISYFVVGSVLMAALALVLLVLVRRRRKMQDSPTLEQRISELSTNLEAAASVVAEIEGEVQARQELVERLKGDAERAEALAKLHKSEVEAVAQALRAELTWFDRRTLKSNIIIGIVGYVLGVISSILVNIFVP